MKYLAAGIMIILIIFSACGKMEESKAGKVAGVSLLTRGHVFYKDLEEGLRREAAKIGETTIGVIRNYFAGAEVPKVIPAAVGIVDLESLERRNWSKYASSS